MPILISLHKLLGIYIIIIRIIMFIVTVLAQPTFDSATINEGEVLSITCVTGNIREITSFQVLDPRGMPVPTTDVGMYTLMNALRNASGLYTCIVTNTMTNATINATSTVVVQCESCRSRILALLFNWKYCCRGLNLAAEPHIVKFWHFGPRITCMRY